MLFLDNLESLQSEQNYELTSEQVNAWIKAATALGNDGLVLILTSRWKIPNWPEENCIQLTKLRYHDFIMLAQTLNCPLKLLEQKDKLRRLHNNLHGNGRGLEFFLAAINSLDDDELKIQKIAEFEQQLANSKEELQTDMTLNVIARHLNDNDKIILKRMTAYQSPVSQQGVLILVDALAGVTMEKQTALASLQRLVNCSLLEHHNGQNDESEYFCSPVVSDWLYSNNNNYIDKTPLPEAILIAAADCQLKLFESGKNSLEQALAVYNAYLATEQKDTAYQFADDYIIGGIELAGMYQILLDDWMPELQKAHNQKLKGKFIDFTGRLYVKIGEYDTALDYLKESLAIWQKIGDKQGEGFTLNNIAEISKIKGDYDKALEYLKQSLVIKQENNDKQAKSTALNNISVIHRAEGNYDKALDYLKQSLVIDQEVGDKRGEGTTLNNIAEIHGKRGDYNTALEYIKQSLAIVQEIGDKQMEGMALHNISHIYKAKGDCDTALDYLKQSLAIKQEIGDKTGLCATLFNMGHIHIENKEIQEAIKAWLKVYSIAKPIGFAEALQALENLAEQLGLPNGLEAWEALYRRAQAAQQEEE